MMRKKALGKERKDLYLMGNYEVVQHTDCCSGAALLSGSKQSNKQHWIKGIVVHPFWASGVSKELPCSSCQSQDLFKSDCFQISPASRCWHSLRFTSWQIFWLDSPKTKFHNYEESVYNHNLVRRVTCRQQLTCIIFFPCAVTVVKVDHWDGSQVKKVRLGLQ